MGTVSVQSQPAQLAAAKLNDAASGYALGVGKTSFGISIGVYKRATEDQIVPYTYVRKRLPGSLIGWWQDRVEIGEGRSPVK